MSRGGEVARLEPFGEHCARAGASVLPQKTIQGTAVTACPVPEAARALNVRPGTLRRWVREGCPTVHRGRRGRGHAELVDPEQVRAWRGAGERDAAILELASALPDVLADAIAQAHRHANGVDKRALAGILTAAWYTAATAALDHLREQCPAVPELASLPDEIERLRKINKTV